MKTDFVSFGKKGATIRWSNYRGHLVEELRGLTTKHELDFYLSLNPSNQSLREALMELRKRNESGHTK